MTDRLLSAAQIWAAKDIEEVDVEVPEWPAPDGTPGIVRLRAVSGEEATAFIDQVREGRETDGNMSLALRILIMSAVDSEGNRIFQKEDLDRLRGKSLRALVRLQEKALRINGLTQEAREEVKKDSAGEEPGDSPSASPSD